MKKFSEVLFGTLMHPPVFGLGVVFMIATQGPEMHFEPTLTPEPDGTVKMHFINVATTFNLKTGVRTFEAASRMGGVHREKHISDMSPNDQIFYYHLAQRACDLADEKLKNGDSRFKSFSHDLCTFSRKNI